MMPVVAAVSVCPTCAVPEIVGAPVAGLLVAVLGASSLTLPVAPSTSQTVENVLGGLCAAVS